MVTENSLAAVSRFSITFAVTTKQNQKINEQSNGEVNAFFSLG